MITSANQLKAGRCDPFRAPDTDPSLGRAPGESALQGSRGPQNGGLGRSCTLTELGVCVAVMRTGGLRFFRLVPHCTTPHSRLLNIETLAASLLLRADISLDVPNGGWWMWRVADEENNHFLVVPHPLFAKYFPAESVGIEPTPTGLKGRCSTTTPRRSPLSRCK